MADHDEHYEANRLNWDERASIHARSEIYAFDAYRNEPDRIGSVVALDADRLGDLTGTRTVHLQCHIGTDALSLARLGAEVTGLDISDASIQIARELFADTATPGRFEVGNVYDAPAILGERYDLVYTGVGALCWLPNIDRWAAVVAELLAPGGRLFIREGHPALWALQDELPEGDTSLLIEYPYFEKGEPTAFDDDETYTDQDAPLANTRTYSWNHGMGEIITALLDHGLVLEAFEEHRTVPWQALPHMTERLDETFELPPAQRDLVPLSYTLQARKPE